MAAIDWPILRATPHWRISTIILPLRATRLSAILAVVLAATACAGAAPAGSPTTGGTGTPATTAAAVSTPEPEATPTAEPTTTLEPTEGPPSEPTTEIVEGDCVDFNGDVEGDITEFRAVACDSSDARYRVVAVEVLSVSCPSTAEYTVTTFGGADGLHAYCLSDQLSGEERAIEDASKGDCVHLKGKVSVDELELVACDDRSANYRILSVVGIAALCSRRTDRAVSITSLTIKTLCLQRL
jgi:hypothetical protein